MATSFSKSQHDSRVMNIPIVGCIMYGGIGNRMFQYASTYGLARLNNRIHRVVHVCSDINHNIQLDDYSSLFGYDSKHVSNSQFDIKFILNKLKYQWVIFMEPPNKNQTVAFHKFEESAPSNICVNGYLQNEDYFIQWRNEILIKFAEPVLVTKYLKEKYTTENSEKYGCTLSDLENMYFIHVRLGDYYRIASHKGYHFIDLNIYYKNAITLLQSFDANAKFVVFTEDIPGLQEVYPWLMRYPVIYETNDLAGLYMLKRCRKGGICANSSYSWWGAWLNENPLRRTILPNKWFTSLTERLTMKNALYVSVESSV